MWSHTKNTSALENVNVSRLGKKIQLLLLTFMCVSVIPRGTIGTEIYFYKWIAEKTIKFSFVPDLAVNFLFCSKANSKTLFGLLNLKYFLFHQ